MVLDLISFKREDGKVVSSKYGTTTDEFLVSLTDTEGRMEEYIITKDSKVAAEQTARLVLE